MLLPIFQRYRVQAVFSGHDHDYERSIPTNGVHCFVAGGGGSVIMYNILERDPLCAHFWKNHHVVKVWVTCYRFQCRRRVLDERFGFGHQHGPWLPPSIVLSATGKNWMRNFFPQAAALSTLRC